jgi:hypothetical protein
MILIVALERTEEDHIAPIIFFMVLMVGLKEGAGEKEDIYGT